MGTATLAGCASPGGPGTGEMEYYVAANGVGTPPTEATVVEATDSRIRGVQPIQTALERARESGNAQITVMESEYERVVDALEETPLYTDESGYATDEGLYVRSNGSVVRVSAYSRRLA